MTDEPSARSSRFVAGLPVRLADGRDWSLPLRDPMIDDPEYDALLAAFDDAEDHAETLRAGLALAIFLLARNYDLAGEALAALLRFAPGDPALADFQRAVHEVARASCQRLKRASLAPARPPSRGLRSTLARWPRKDADRVRGDDRRSKNS